MAASRNPKSPGAWGKASVDLATFAIPAAKGTQVASNLFRSGRLVRNSLQISHVRIMSQEVGGFAKIGDTVSKSLATDRGIIRNYGIMHVTPHGIILPPGSKYQIPKQYAENLYRQGSYGEYINGKFIERLRIDPATPPGMKGPNNSHYHRNGASPHYSPYPKNNDPGFYP